MKKINQINLSGNLVRDFESRLPKTNNGKLGNFLGSTLAYTASHFDEENSKWLQGRPQFFDIIISDTEVQALVDDKDIRSGDFIEVVGRLCAKENGTTYINVKKIVEVVPCQKNREAKQAVSN